MVHLSNDAEDCLPEFEGIEETNIRLPLDTPLVGFHGRTNGYMLNSLGLILFNKKDPMCQTPLSSGQSYIYSGSIFD